MGSMTWTKPSSIITGLTNGDTTKVGTHTKHDQPLWLLHSVIVRLGVPHRLPISSPGFLDLIRGSVSDEDGFAAPFNNHVLAFGDASKLHLGFCKGKDISRSSHGLEETSEGRLGSRRREDTQ